MQAVLNKDILYIIVVWFMMIRSILYIPDVYL